jgi:hypothetical protein
MGPQFGAFIQPACGAPAVSVCTFCEGPLRFVGNGPAFFAVMDSLLSGHAPSVIITNDCRESLFFNY